MTVVGRCRLCLNEAGLQNSHFIPQAAYKRVRGEGKNPNPIVVQDGKTIQTSAQTRAHLLCHDCEQRLSKNGEHTFFLNCYRGPGKFRLLQVLKEQKPLLEDDRFAAYAVPESENSVIEQIGYMGLSVLWKSAAHAWKDRGSTIPSISLGSPYQEQIRQFLLKAGPFPEYAAMLAEVSDQSNRLIQIVGTPATSKFSTHYLHWIDLCGVRFNLIVGARMPRRIRELCMFRPGRKAMLVAKRQEWAMASDYRELLRVLVANADRLPHFALR
jgi:hypothetical protein